MSNVDEKKHGDILKTFKNMKQNLKFSWKKF